MIALLLLLAAGPELLRVESPRVVVDVVRDSVTLELCSGEAEIAFQLERAATIGFELDGRHAEAVIDGRIAAGSGLSVQPGSHVLRIPAGDAARRLTTPGRYRLLAHGAAGEEASVAGEIRGEWRNRPVLPVGRTFVSGVDLLDGHLVLTATDLKLDGRHLALQVSRTFSSAARAATTGVAGAGWSTSYAMRLIAIEACGCYVVPMLDGSTQTFQSKDGGKSFWPQLGYHTTLWHDPEGGFDFIDKAANRFHFAGPGEARRLDYIEEPHHDRIELRYDARGLVESVAEVHQPAPGIRLIVRSLRFGWTAAGGADRIAWIEASGLGPRVDYTYDAHGNLVSATRSDPELADPAVDSYAYSVSDPVDPHQLLSQLHEGKSVTYRYHQPTDFLPGEGSASLSPFGKAEVVREVVDVAAHTDFRFAFDHSQAGAGRFRTTVQAVGAGSDVYLLNRNGSCVEIRQPDAQGMLVTKMEYDTDGILKLAEVNNRGFSAVHSYDPRGNRVASGERAKLGGSTRTTRCEYHPTFNNLVGRQDPDGRWARWLIDPRSGDVVRESKPDGTVTQYGYDSQGNLLTSLGPDGRRVTYSRHDSYGQATLLEWPGGHEWKRFDLRGRSLPPEAVDPKRDATRK